MILYYVYKILTMKIIKYKYCNHPASHSSRNNT
jgi:hypothetical protein